MNKKNILWILLHSVFLIVFNVVFFIAGGTEHSVSVWISYSFIHVAYMMLLVTPLLVRKNTNTAVLGFPIYSISSTYFMAAFIVGLVFMFIHLESYKAALIVQVIIAGIYAALLILHLIANENTADSIEHHEMELLYVKNASFKLKGIMDSVKDKQFRKKIEKLYDLLHSSPAKSNSVVRDYELTVLELIDVLERDIDKNDFAAAEVTISKIERNASERNRKLR